MRGQPRHRGGRQVDAGDRGEVVEKDRHRRCVGHGRVVPDEDVGGHLRLEEAGRPDEHRVGAEIRGACRRRDRRPGRLAAGADDERPAARDRLARRRDRAIALVVVQQRRFPVRAEHHEAGERPGRELFVGARQPLEVQAIVGIERRRQRREYPGELHRVIVAT